MKLCKKLIAVVMTVGILAALTVGVILRPGRREEKK